jgi:hypothetical protein
MLYESKSAMAAENDIVLVYFEEQPLVFARIEEILPDIKPDWYHVKLLMLQVPLQVVSWILRDVYINGDEFTMDGKKMRLELVESPEAKRPSAVDEPVASSKKPVTPSKKQDVGSGNGKVISLKDLKKK